MIYVENEHIICCDVDDTLIMWSLGNSTDHKAIPLERTLEDGMVIVEYVLPHNKHIQQLKTHKTRGHYIIVWSAGGSQWAKNAVKLLGIENYVDLVMAKPTWCYDDKQPEDYMPRSQWIKDE